MHFSKKKKKKYWRHLPGGLHSVLGGPGADSLQRQPFQAGDQQHRPCQSSYQDASQCALDV